MSRSPQMPECLDADRRLGDDLREAGPRGGRRDAALVDLQVRNVSRAIADGGLGSAWQLGAAIGRVLCEGQD